MPTPAISQLTLPSGTTYEIKDAQARAAIEALAGGDAVIFGGVTTTAITDGGTQKPTVDGNQVDPTRGQLYFYGTQEFLWDGDKWIELGSLDALGNLAYKDSITSTFSGTAFNSTGSFTPSGSVSVSTATTENKTATVSAASSGTTTYTPAGTVSQPTFSGSSLTSTGAFTPEGSVSFTNGNKTATVSTTTGTATYTPAGTVSQPTFTGDSLTSTGSYTPAGSVSLTNTNKTAAVSPAESGTTTYTPAGSVSTPTISVKTAGSTTTVKNPTKVTVAKTVVAAAPGATAPSNAVTYYSVSGETLSLYQLGYTTGDSITTSDVTVKTGDAAYQSTQPSFTGTGVRLVTDNISVPNSASFTGTAGTVSVSGTPGGTVSQPSFTGTGARLVTGNISVPTSASFTGTEGTVSVSGTPAGTVTQPTFSGTAVRLVTGNIAVPSTYDASFTGTAGTVTVSGTPTGSVTSTAV